MAGKLGSRSLNGDLRPMLPGAAITQHAGVYLSAAYQVKMPTSDVAVQCYGVAIESASAASTTDTIKVQTQGQVEVIAGEALSVEDKVTLRGTSGRFFVATPGEPVAGLVVGDTGTAAGYRVIIELNVAKPTEDTIVKYSSAASITDDTSFTLNNVAGTYILDYAFWTADGVVTGGLKLGTTSGGAEIFTGWATSSGSNVYRPSDCADAVTAAASAWTLTADDTLYLADVTSWNSITVSKFIIQFRRIY